MNKLINFITTHTDLSTQQAWWLLEFVTEKTRTQLQISSDELNAEQQENLQKYIKQLVDEHKPLAYILGWVPFLDLKLFVAPPTLIPRPETEFWVDQLIERIKIGYGGHGISSECFIILDIGTGSGCIALSLAQTFPSAHVYAVDIAQSALDLAQKNARENNITNVTFLQSNLFAQLPTDLKFDLIVSNPPYIDPAAELESSVNDWEDHGALFAANHGLQIIEQIVHQASNWLKKNNESGKIPQLVIEIDASQGQAVQQLTQSCGFAQIKICKDQFDRDRTLWIK